MNIKNGILLKLIKLLVTLFEQTQSFCNSDIYSIIRIKDGNKIDKYIRNSHENSYKSWLQEFQEKESSSIIHNIAYNYWIRSNAAYKINKKNIVKRIIYIIILFANSIIFFIFLIRVTLSKINIKEDKNYTNKTQANGNCKYQFITYLNQKSYYSILEKLRENFDEPIIFTNIEINYTFTNMKGFSTDHIKIDTLKTICKYLIKYPFMVKYHNNLYKSLYIYKSFKDKNIFKNNYTLCSEVYSLVSRAISIASLDYKGKSFYIDHSKFDALPYEIYSLFREKKLININEIFKDKQNKTKRNFYKKKNSEEILIQASDGCGTISNYEFYCYSAIIQIFKELNYEGKLIFKFHPANSNFTIFLKKFYCREISKDLDKVRLFFFHKERDIEYFARKSKLVISIDYSTSFNEIINNGSKIIYFNYLKRRSVINKNNSIYENKKFKMITSNADLKKELRNDLIN